MVDTNDYSFQKLIIRVTLCFYMVVIRPPYSICTPCLVPCDSMGLHQEKVGRSAKAPLPLPPQRSSQSVLLTYIGKGESEQGFVQNLVSLGKDHLRGHSQILNLLVRRDPLFAARSDYMPLTYMFNKLYKIDKNTTESWSQSRQLSTLNGLVWFSGGSISDADTGARIYGLKPSMKHSFSFSRFETVLFRLLHMKTLEEGT